MITKERLQKWMENYPATIDLKKKAKKRNGDLPHKTCALCKKN